MQNSPLIYKHSGLDSQLQQVANIGRNKYNFELNKIE